MLLCQKHSWTPGLSSFAFVSVSTQSMFNFASVGLVGMIQYVWFETFDWASLVVRFGLVNPFSRFDLVDLI